MAVTGIGVRNQTDATVARVRTTEVSIASGTEDHTPHHVAQRAPRENCLQGATSFSDTSDHQVIAATGDASFPFLYIVSLQVANKGGSSAVLSLKDGSGGSTIAYAYAQTVTGRSFLFDPPLKVPTSGHGLFIAADASSSTIYVSAQGFKSDV